MLAAFFNGLKNKLGYIMAKASALRMNLNILPSVPSIPRPPARNSHAHQIHALNLSHHILGQLTVLVGLRQLTRKAEELLALSMSVGE